MVHFNSSWAMFAHISCLYSEVELVYYEVELQADGPAITTSNCLTQAKSIILFWNNMQHRSQSS